MTETALFELDQPPPIRKGAQGYVEYLAGLEFRADNLPDEPWTFWALAPVNRHFSQQQAGLVEHVWLTRSNGFAQAVVDVRTGRILACRQYQTRPADPDRHPRKVT